MARSTSLSDRAFRALRSQKQQGESDSDVVLRLVQEATRRKRDPMAFFRKPPEPEAGHQRLEKIQKRMRDQDIARMKEDSRANREG